MHVKKGLIWTKPSNPTAAGPPTLEKHSKACMVIRLVGRKFMSYTFFLVACKLSEMIKPFYQIKRTLKPEKTKCKKPPYWNS